MELLGKITLTVLCLQAWWKLGKAMCSNDRYEKLQRERGLPIPGSTIFFISSGHIAWVLILAGWLIAVAFVWFGTPWG